VGPRGYEFLLQDVAVQMWRFAEEFIKPADRGAGGGPGGGGREGSSGGRRLFSLAPEAVLRLLFSLSYCEVGQDYPVAALSAEEETVRRGTLAFFPLWDTVTPY